MEVGNSWEKYTVIKAIDIDIYFGLMDGAVDLVDISNWVPSLV